MKKTKIVPAIINAHLKTKTKEQVAHELGYTVEQIQACIDTCDLNSLQPVWLSSLTKTSRVPYGSLFNKSPKDIAGLLETRTIPEVAQLMNVSPSTVSRYISKHCLRAPRSRVHLKDGLSIGVGSMLDMMREDTINGFCEKYKIDKQDILNLFKVLI